MKNVSKVKNCFGCGVCAVSCPKNIIDIRLNDDGFYQPFIDEPDKCIHCKLCVENCAFLHKDLALENRVTGSWCGWSNDSAVLARSASGGIGFEIARHLLHSGYKVCGVRYNANERRAEHFIADSEDALAATMGSKYIQSYTVDGFSAINRKDSYLVVGTPCQIDSFRRYIRRLKIEDHFVLMDFFCHCVPSMHAWREYLRLAQKSAGAITSVVWRDKTPGWHDSWAMLVKGSGGTLKSRLSQGDLFYKFFLGDVCCGKACMKQCKYKWDKSSADIRIGDAWGDTYSRNDAGVSTIVSFTDKGREVVESLNGCTINPHPLEVAAEGQMHENVHRAAAYGMFMFLLRKGIKLPAAGWNAAFTVNKILRRLKIKI